MFKWIKAELVFTPEVSDAQEILVVGDQILAVGNDLLDLLSGDAHVERIDAGPGSVLVPGFIDNHVHIIGGGGEGGYHTRVPEIQLTDITTCGVTTVIGVLGTDDVTRHLESLLAKARGLEAEGISAFILTGSYSLPTPTLTGSIKRDLLLIDKVLGAGEIAISDHRASKASFQALKDAAVGVRLGGMLSGKGGILQLHVGDDAEGLGPVKRLLEERVLPRHQILPTHVNRTKDLFAEALEYVRDGGQIDLTAFDFPNKRALTAVEAVQQLLAEDLSLENVTMSSDSNGSLPEVDDAGRIIGLRQAKMSVMTKEFCSLIADVGLEWSQALPLVTSNPARLFGLSHKGNLAAGMDADITIFQGAHLDVAHVMAKGQWLVRNQQPVVTGTFETNPF